VVVDENGTFYGRLTLNQYVPDAIANSGLLAWLQGVCQE
jgi:hypothetical protein